MLCGVYGNHQWENNNIDWILKQGCAICKREPQIFQKTTSMLLCAAERIPEDKSPGGHDLSDHSVRSLSQKVGWVQLQFIIIFNWDHLGFGRSSSKDYK